jgi:DNA topoisomerase-3
VLADNSNRRVTIMSDADLKKKMAPKAEQAPKPKVKKKPANSQEQTSNNQQTDEYVGKPCPVCGQGTIIKGKTAYGCSRWREGCNFRKPFE